MSWNAKITLEVQGEKEGAVIVSVEYQDTTREMAVGLQNKLLQLGIDLNKKGM